MGRFGKPDGFIASANLDAHCRHPTTSCAGCRYVVSGSMSGWQCIQLCSSPEQSQCTIVGLTYHFFDFGCCLHNTLRIQTRSKCFDQPYPQPDYLFNRFFQHVFIDCTADFGAIDFRYVTAPMATNIYSQNNSNRQKSKPCDFYSIHFICSSRKSRKYKTTSAQGLFNRDGPQRTRPCPWVLLPKMDG